MNPSKNYIMGILLSCLKTDMAELLIQRQRNILLPKNRWGIVSKNARGTCGSFWETYKDNKDSGGAIGARNLKEAENINAC